MKSWIVVSLLIFLTLGSRSAFSSAEPQLMVVPMGQCGSPALTASELVFSKTLRERLGGQLLDGAQAAQRFKTVPRKSLEEVHSDLKEAHEKYRSLFPEAAMIKLQRVFDELNALPGSAERWSMKLDAELLSASISVYQKKFHWVDESFRRILRMVPDYRLDEDYFSPIETARFEKLRREMKSTPRVTLEVQSRPPGAQVAIEGLPLGKTPLKTSLVAGEYQVRVASGSALSVPRLIHLKGNHKLEIDLGFESSVTSANLPCVDDLGNEGTRVDRAAKLGKLYGVPSIVTLRVIHETSGENKLEAAMVTVATSSATREAKISLNEDKQLFRRNVGDLVTFLLTGEANDAVEVKTESHAEAMMPSPAPPRARLLPSDGGEQKGQSASFLSDSKTTARTASRGRSPTLKRISYASWAVAGAVLVAATVSILKAQSDGNQLKSHLQRDGSLAAGDTEAQRLQSRLSSESQWATGLFIGGGTAAALGTALFFF